MRRGSPDCILLLSGGIDSATTLAWLRHRDREPWCLVFDYGQTLRRELDAAQTLARRFDCHCRTISLPLHHLAPTNPLLLPPDMAADPHVVLPDGDGIPSGRTTAQIAEAGPPPTYVPFRNGIFLAYAVALGEAHGIADLFCGGNGLHSGQYPDDTEAFARAFAHAADVGTQPQYRPTVTFPMAAMPKAEVVALGRLLGLDYRETWSCYRNGPAHCGRCDSCAQREAAFAPHGLDLEGRRAGS